VIELAAARPAGHPTWHLLVVALAAIAVFIGIKVEEHFRAHPLDRTNRAIDRSGPLLALAFWSSGAAGIHASVCADHFHEFFAFGVFFVVAAALQAVWAVVICLRPTRAALLAGAVGNLFVVLLWAVSRTFGLPIGPEAWHPEAVSTLDVLASVLEVALVVGASVLLTRDLPHDGRDAHRSATTAATT
jgi:hypothetical protein